MPAAPPRAARQVQTAAETPGSEARAVALLDPTGSTRGEAALQTSGDTRAAGAGTPVPSLNGVPPLPTLPSSSLGSTLGGTTNPTSPPQGPNNPPDRSLSPR